MYKILCLTPTSVTFERVNEDIFYASTAIDIFCDKKKIISQEKRNVFSVYGLNPNQEYHFDLGDESVVVKTKNVSIIFYANDFGAVGDGIHDDTKAINQAIMILPKNGLLKIKKGTYFVTSIFLKSDIYIELEEGATLLASSKEEDYCTIPGELDLFDQSEKLQIGQWEGNPFPMKTSVITGYWINNVQFYGQGTVDGNAQNSTFWHDVRSKTFGRPRLVFLDGCENIQFQGIHFQNTACWTLHPFFCKQIGFYNIYIKNPKDSPNTDGMDPESVDGLDVIGVEFSVGDDCIALKSGKIYMGQRYKTPCQNITIRNCLMNDGHGAIVLGSEMGGGIKNLSVERCIFLNTDRGLRIKTRRGRGDQAVVDGVLFKNILMDGVLTPLVCNMFYFCDPDGKTEFVWSKEKLPVDKSTPYLGKFHFLNIHAINSEYAAGYFYGLPEMPIGEIIIENSSFSFKKECGKGFPAMMSFIDEESKKGLYFNNVKSVILKNVEVKGQDGEEVIPLNVESLKVE